jgi:hypothetical protein
MKKRLFSVIAAIAFGIVFSTSAIATEWSTSRGSCFAKGDKYLDVGIPLPMFPAGAHAAFDYAFHDAISGGGGMGFRYYYGSSAHLTFVFRGAFHPFNLVVLQDKINVRDKLDVYVGPAFWVGPSLNGYAPDIWAREFFGARWHFTPKLSAFIEDCGGFGYLDGGITFKF